MHTCQEVFPTSRATHAHGCALCRAPASCDNPPENRFFLEWLTKVHGGEWSPDTPLQRRLDDVKSDDIITRRWAEEQVQRYYKSELSTRLATAGPRKGEPISESTKQGAITAIASFFKALPQSRAWFPSFKEGEEIMLGALPFFHVFGLTCAMNIAVYRGWGDLLVPKPQPEPT